jgi:addiction module RelB/DinJ family antitoxin
MYVRGVNEMAQINIRMDSKLKEETESILSELGLNMSIAVNMYARQIVRQKGIPFPLVLEAGTVTDSVRQKRQLAVRNFFEFAKRNKVLEIGYEFERDTCYDA